MFTHKTLDIPLFATLFVGLHIGFALYSIVVSFGPVFLDGMYYTAPILFYIPTCSLVLDGITLLLHIPETLPQDATRYSICRRLSKCIRMMYIMSLFHIVLTWTSYSDITVDSSLMRSLSTSWSQDSHLQMNPHPLAHIQSSLQCCGFWNSQDRPFMPVYDPVDTTDPMSLELHQLTLEIDMAECEQRQGCAYKMMLILNVRWNHVKWVLLGCRCVSVLLLVGYLWMTRREHFIDGVVHITLTRHLYYERFSLPTRLSVHVTHSSSTIDAIPSDSLPDIFIMDPVPEYKVNNDGHFDEPPPYYYQENKQ